MNRRSVPDLYELLELFPAGDGGLADFTEVQADELPAPYGQLLAHNHHMTVTVESFHGSPVDVEVLERRLIDERYARKILLRRQSDRAVVQFGIVMLDFSYLSDEVRDDIIGERIPLGRTLIEHNVLRDVQLVALWKVVCGPELARLFLVEPGTLTYGRTALIYCNGEPAVELLEIVVPAATMRS